MNGDTCWVNLNERGICEVCALAVACHGCGAVATHRVCRKEICITVTACSDNYGVSCEALELTCNEVLGDDAACAFNTVLVFDKDEFMHLIAVVALHLTELDLAVERAVCTEKKLLTCLTFGVECAAHLSATE